MDLKKVFLYFLGWRVLLFIILLFSIQILPLQYNFLGGSLSNYLEKPYLWAWGNFDGEHYLSIARSGYQSLTYFYFPLYPILIKQIANFLQSTFLNYLFSGLLISHISFVLGLIGLYKLIRIDYSERIGSGSILLLMLFPTSFYFAGVYTESLFFALIVWSFYFARIRNWYLAGIFGGLSAVTRITGLALLPALLVEYLLTEKLFKRRFTSDDFKNLTSISLVFIGLLCYMLFLFKKTGDPLAFFHNLNSVFGEQRSSTLILLPQVFYRYFFRIIPNLTYNYFPAVFSIYLELITSLIFLILIIAAFFKTRISYALFSLIAYLLPTLSGSFSSLPRYVLIIFPAFIITTVYLDKVPKVIKITIYIILFVSLVIATSFFVRGYWIS